MIIQGEIVDPEITRVYKSINDNLKNKDVFTSDNPDTANTGAVEILPPVPMRECFYIFKESSHVANCCRILASDIIYNTITLTPATENPEEHLVNQVNKIPVAMPEEPTIPVAQPSPAEMMMGGGASGEKAAGRDYLMELLKK